MQIRQFSYELERVFFCFCILCDIESYHTKFHNCTPKCSGKTLAQSLISVNRRGEVAGKLFIKSTGEVTGSVIHILKA